VKADIEKGAEKNPWSLCSCMRERRERKNGGFLRLIEEDQVFNNLDCVSVSEMKQ
jgi:hypothetical protein